MTMKDVQPMVGFSQYQATKKLCSLAENPFDLTAEGNLTPERLRMFCTEACGYKLLYGTERITETELQALQELSIEAQAIEKMEKMQAGEVMNRIEGHASENRAVLHTALRDFFDNPNPAQQAKEATALAKKEFHKLQEFMENIDQKEKFTDLIMIGIGGSDLGPRANFLALQPFAKPRRNVHFISNVDPDDAASVLRKIGNLETCLVVVISKSGTTLETGTNEGLVKSHFLGKNLKPEEHFISVTGKGSPMDNPQKYLKSFYLWDWVGGRYSSTSMVGGVMLSFAYGFDAYRKFLKGASAMDKCALNRNFRQNLPLLGALLAIWNHNFLKHPTLAIIPYCQSLCRFPAHIQQVEMESNGKRIDRHGYPVNFQTGPIIWGEPGTNAQHSFFQLLHQGTEIVPMEFIGFQEGQYQEDFEYQGTTSREKLLANLFAQVLALATGKKDDNPNKVFSGNRPSHLLLSQRLTPFSLGALLSYFENKAAFQGFIWNINSFDQEGVQLGKILAEKIIHRFASRRRKETGELYPLGDALLDHLEPV